MIEPIARIRIELQDLEPKIRRRVDVPVSSTLMALHDIIQVTLGWTDLASVSSSRLVTASTAIHAR